MPSVFAALRRQPGTMQSGPTCGVAGAPSSASARTDSSASSSEEVPLKQERPKSEVEQTRPFVPSVQVVVKIDATSMSPQGIAELVRAMQAPPELIVTSLGEVADVIRDLSLGRNLSRGRRERAVVALGLKRFAQASSS
jgi:hypothetical protein